MGRIAVGITLTVLGGCQGSTIGPAAPPATPADPPEIVVPEVELGTDLSELDLAPVAHAVTGGHLTLLDDGVTAAIADPLGDRLVLVDWTTGELIGSTELPAYSEPGRVAQSHDGTVWVALRRGDRVIGVSPDDGRPLVEVGTCVEPRGLAAAGDGAMWVACASGMLVKFDEEGVLAQVPVRADLRDVVVDPSGGLWVSRFRSAEVLRVDPARGPVATYDVGGFTEDFVGRFLPSDFEGAVAWRLLARPDEGVIVVHQRARTSPVDIRESAGESTLPPYYGPVDPFPIDPQDPPEGSCSGIIHGSYSVIGPDGHVVTSKPIRGAALPTDAVPNGQGGLYVAVAGAAAGTEADASVIEVGEAAHLGSPDCYEPAPVLGAVDSVISSVAVAPSGEVLALAEQPLTLYVDGTARFAAAASDVDGAFRRFHRNPSFGVTCAGCHPEGHEDGHTWVFRTDRGDVARRTQALGEGLLDTLPLHWDGEFGSFDELMDEVWGRRMGGDDLAPSEVDDLADYVDTLPRPRSTPRRPGLVPHGAELFATAGCATCHEGPALTDNQTYDVGTGGRFQVPSLIGVASRTPLLHDGCAETLRDRFDPECGGDAHGNTAGLSPSEIDALVAYLETL